LKMRIKFSLILVSILCACVSAHGQNFEVACPLGETPIGNHVTFDTTTNLYRAWACQNNITGAVTMQADTYIGVPTSWATLPLSGTNTGTGMILAPTATSGGAFTLNSPSSYTGNIFSVNLPLDGNPHISLGGLQIGAGGGGNAILGNVQQITATKFLSQNASGSSTGAFNLASGDSISWRNNAGTADVPLAENTSDSLTWNGNVIATTSGPVGSLPVTAVDLTAQSANIGATTIVTPSANGFYRFNCYIVKTVAPTSGSPSSTLPACNLGYTDGDTGIAKSGILVTQTNASNAVGVVGAYVSGDTKAFPAVFYAASGAAITYATTGYASVGSLTMTYAIHIRLEGPF